jgi:GT2 family glycosyltransferase
VRERTTYRNFEIVIVDNDSDDPDTLAYLRGVDAKVVRYPHRFNYARQMNLAAEEATGDQILFLNNDLEVITPGWLEAMVELAQHDEVGAVGARLLFPGGRAQHEGVFIGFGGGSAGNADFGGYFGLGRMIRDATAVTAACLLMRLEPFHAIGGFDERLRVAFNDVDLCLRLRQQGYQVVYTPYAELFHAESASRGKLHPAEDEEFFVRRWGTVGTFRDPFYNPNLDAERPFCLRR